jgi:O-Antigen ligase
MLSGRASGRTIAAWTGLVVLAGVWAWWAAEDGAYFGPVMYPGLVVLAGAFALISSRAAWPWRFTLSRPAWIGLGATLLLGAWFALSALWSPAPDIALADAQRIFGYALAFGLGAWVAALLGGRRTLALIPLAFAGLFAGALAAVELLTSTNTSQILDEGTLQYPLGYRNANAAFFLIAAWPAIALASSRTIDWRIRALAAAAATLSIEMGMLSQSRGSLIAVAFAVVVFLVPARDRATRALWLGLTVLPALVLVPALTDLYQVAGVDGLEATEELRAAGKAAIGGAVLAGLIGALAAIWTSRTAQSGLWARADRLVGVLSVGAVVAGAIAFIVAVGNPVSWVEERVDEFLTQSTPESTGSSRFGVNAGTERDDMWRVALEVAGEDPLLGAGGGGYQYDYLVRRSEEGVESVRDAHSAPLEVLSESGIPGLLMFCVALGGMAVGVWRAQGLDPANGALAAGALAAAAYWLAHTSLDWFWPYPVVTAPVFALLGSACCVAAGEPAGEPGPWRRLAPLAAGLLALSVVFPFLSERYVNAAYDGWRDDPQRASDDLDRARTLNPLSLEPLLAEGAIAQADRRREDAIAAFEEAADKRPEEWAAHYFIAELTRRTDPGRARAELEIARELNPYGKEIAALADELGSANGDG